MKIKAIITIIAFAVAAVANAPIRVTPTRVMETSRCRLRR